MMSLDVFVADFELLPTVFCIAGSKWKGSYFHLIAFYALVPGVMYFAGLFHPGPVLQLVLAYMKRKQ